MFANSNYAKKADFVKAVLAGEPVVLWSPELGVPAINGVHVVESWSHLQVTEYWRAVKRVQDLSGWTCKVRVLDMRVVEVLQ